MLRKYFFISSKSQLSPLWLIWASKIPVSPFKLNPGTIMEMFSFARLFQVLSATPVHTLLELNKNLCVCGKSWPVMMVSTSMRSLIPWHPSSVYGPHSPGKGMRSIVPEQVRSQGLCICDRIKIQQVLWKLRFLLLYLSQVGSWSSPSALGSFRG